MREEGILALPRRTAIIGGGGKTTLLFLLGRKAAEAGRSVLLTTTTHLAWPPPEEILCLDPADGEALRAAARAGRPVLAGRPAGGGRMTGLSPALLEQAALAFDCVICEADGSRGMPLKWHREGEPCVPPETELLVQVAGLSALGRPAKTVLHRWEEAGFDRARPVTEEDVAGLVLRGFDRCGPIARKVCLLNQADVPDGEACGGRIARRLSERGVPCGICVLKEEQVRCWY